MNKAKREKIEEYRKENKSCLFNVAGGLVGIFIAVSAGTFVVQSVFKKYLPYQPYLIQTFSLLTGGAAGTYYSVDKTKECMRRFHRNIDQIPDMFDKKYGKNSKELPIKKTMVDEHGKL